MSAMIWRVIIAVFVAVFVWQLIPPVCRVLSVNLSSDIELILHLCVAALLVLYILTGPDHRWWIKA